MGQTNDLALEVEMGNDGRSASTLTAVISMVLMISATAVAVVTGHWFLTAIPVGILFGVFLQKGDLCGASAFSEVLTARDTGKIRGLWVAIVVSMVGIALGDLMGWIELNPKPFVWANMALGGLVFGVGMVLAGGCVSGCVYKAAEGNINSIAALVAMPLGIALVEYGPLREWFTTLKGVRLTATDGGSVTVSSVTGLPFWALAVVLSVATVAAAWVRRRPAATSGPTSQGKKAMGANLQPFWRRSWKPWQAGIAIGLLALPAYLSSAASGRNYPLGVTHGVLHAALLVTDAPVNHVTAPAPRQPASQESAPAKPAKKVVWWLVLLVGGMMLGSNASGRLSGQVRLLPKPPQQTLVAILGGFLVGTGAAFATGCVIGNILSGWAMASVGTMLFGVVAILANWVTTYFYLLGGQLPRAS